ncbi:Stk1 family PASTA domain-containing Ser/Thr kinase [Blastococcus sp. HT6-30]|uniref:Stk1 family PASTA domain-containing Ser/Thr kinase n=1 Tax=Blastococcus sp. HT6-30 TaxID=3144843 RepID=UPI00321BA58C
MTTPNVLGERYEIGGVLGRGGMAEVHHGRDLRLGREVAVKVLRHDLARDPSFQVRFRREAQASASLNHPAIVAVYDTGEDRTPTGATPYIVMEYVEGETLRDVLRREGRLPIERAMSLAADICGALDFSHRNGIVHRDVKPGNVMITPQGTVKVMDFGIARAVSDSAATMTSTAAVIGTAQYLSPEQARGEGVDARSDVYSLGCLLYELVTGAPPFTGDSPVSVAYQHVREDPRLPSSINPDVPPELDAILLKAMSKNPANRYQSAADMRNDLLRALAGQRVEATPVMGDAEKTAIIGAPVGGYASGYGDDDWDDDADRRRKRRIIAIVSVLAVLLLGGAVAAAVALSRGDDTPAVTQVAVPPLMGLDRTAAEQAITGAGLVVGDVAAEVSPTVPEGQVVANNPPSGARVDEGSEVDLVVSLGPDTILVPNVVGLTEEQARANLQAQGFSNISSRPIESIEMPEGRVAAVSPAEDSQAGVDDVITLSISTGTIEMPDVLNRSETDARAALQQAGVGAGQIQRQDVERDDVPAGRVVETDPSAGQDVGSGDTITLLVAVPPPAEEPATPTTTPTTTTTPEPSTPTATTTGGPDDDVD